MLILDVVLYLNKIYLIWSSYGVELVFIGTKGGLTKYLKAQNLTDKYVLLIYFREFWKTN